MLDLKNFKGFAFTQQDNSVEFSKIHMYCTLNNIPYIRLKTTEKCPDDYVPSGSVEWCLLSLGRNLVPDYYPEFLENYLYRKVWREDKWILNRKLFVKPAKKYKKFTGFVTTGTYKKKKKPPLIWSEIVNFTNEWRYYIIAGKVVDSCWYWGDDVNTPEAPELNCPEIPDSFYGTLDFGTLSTGEFALVEAHHSFACGWYGEDIEIYMQWLIDGWIYLTSINDLSEEIKFIGEYNKTVKSYYKEQKKPIEL